MNVTKIISGGQTGADRAALDFAIENKIEIGGFVPNGRLAEDGPLSDKYINLVETDTSDNAERTEMNVIHSDATLIVSNDKLSGGSKLTEQLVLKHRKPILHIDLLRVSMTYAAAKVRVWLSASRCETLNVAGPRASKDPAVYEDTFSLLKLVFEK